MKKKSSIALVITLVLLVSALTSLILFLVKGDFSNPNAAVYRDFAALLEKIEEMYIGEYDVKEISAAAMRAAVDALGDRWSYYLTPEEYAMYMNSSNNQFAGIGISASVNAETGDVVVVYTYPGSPAEMAGIQAGDIILEVDGQPLSGSGIDAMRALLVRPIGDAAELTIVRTDGTIETIEVVYDMVFSDPITFEMIDDNIGYVSIANFEAGAADGFIYAVNQLQEMGARAFIYDVRCNGGGRVNELTRMLDFLLPVGEIFVSVDRDGNEEVTLSDVNMIDAPAVVLVDKYSFSAAEYFAALLSEYGYAQIVGEQTTGKSRSQRTEILPGGGALHISTNQYLTKDRIALFDVGGLTPDYQLSLSDDDITLLMSGNLGKDSDQQLLLALEVVGELIKSNK